MVLILGVEINARYSLITMCIVLGSHTGLGHKSVRRSLSMLTLTVIDGSRGLFADEDLFIPPRGAPRRRGPAEAEEEGDVRQRKAAAGRAIQVSATSSLVAH